MKTKTKMKIKVGDTVAVLAGKDKGKEGAVTQVFPEKELVVVEGVNEMKKHLKSQNREQKGQILTFNGPIHVSNVALKDPKTGKPTRVSVEMVEAEDGTVQKFRKSKKSSETF